MSQFLTYSDISSFRQGLNESRILQKAQESVRLKDTFLSHSSKDVNILPVIINILEKHGGLVYVDKIDTSLPPVTTEQTAAILKKNLQACKHLVLLVTKNSKDSRWIPWELGLADGQKGSRRVALFPVAELAYDTTWTETEYLGLYRRITWGTITNIQIKPGWIVRNHHTNKATTLRKWLQER